MSRSRTATLRIPLPRLHKPSGQARLRWKGQEVWLGPFDQPSVWRPRYAEILTQLDSDAAVLHYRNTPAARSDDSLSVNELCLRFLDHAERYYLKDGKPTSEVDGIRLALGPLVDLFGELPADKFGPVALKTVRQRMVETGWHRNTANQAVGRLRRLFKFGVENEWVPPSVLQGLQAVAPLKAGRCNAPDGPRRQALPQKTIDAVRPFVSQLVNDLIDLQLLTAARSGELLWLTTEMIDRSGEVWRAELTDHKTAWKGHSRTLMFGPKAQPILLRYLSADPKRKLFAITRCAYPPIDERKPLLKQGFLRFWRLLSRRNSLSPARAAPDFAARRRAGSGLRRSGRP